MAVLQSIADDGGKLSWLLVATLPVAILQNFLHGNPVWTAFLLADLAILVLPAVALRNPAAILPPEVTALAVLPGVTRAFDLVWFTDYATYLGVAALALAVVVELALFTEAEMSERFAAGMVVLTTMAAIGAWSMLQYYSDQFLGTDLLGSLDEMMWEFVRATVAGVVAAGVFELYFRRRDPAERVALDGASEDGDTSGDEAVEPSGGESVESPGDETVEPPAGKSVDRAGSESVEPSGGESR